MFKVISAIEAIKEIKDDSTVAIGGAGAGHAVPDKILETLSDYYLQSGHPRNLTTIHPCGVGDNESRGLNHLAHEGLISTDIGGFWGNSPKIAELAKRNKIRGYNFPQGILSQLIGAIASGKPGIITKVGLNTFVDPRLEGGKINEITKDELVEIINVSGEDFLFYKTFPIDVAIIRGTTADIEGNITMEEEVGFFSMLTMAQAAKVNGGIVIAQVKRIKQGHSEPGQVKVPGVFIDYIVQENDQGMTFISEFDAALVKRDEPFKQDDLKLNDIKRIISRRAAMELKKNAFVNLGYGMPDGVPIVAQQEHITNQLVFMIEQGAIAGIPTTGLNFGAMYNPSSIMDDSYQFNFFQGGGLDLAFLGFAEVDQNGNVNSSRFGNTITGCGGSIDISQNAKKVIFCGSFAVKAQFDISTDGVKTINKGSKRKFINNVQQVTFSGQYAIEKGQDVLYITERAVFKLTPGGLELIEIAPGIDLQQDILDMMDFRPIINDSLKKIDTIIYSNNLLNLSSFD